MFLAGSIVVLIFRATFDYMNPWLSTKLFQLLNPSSMWAKELEIIGSTPIRGLLLYGPPDGIRMSQKTNPLCGKIDQRKRFGPGTYWKPYSLVVPTPELLDR
jgi:hypothetical protein